MSNELSEYSKGLLERWHSLRSELQATQEKIETLESLIEIEGLNTNIPMSEREPKIPPVILSEHRTEINRRQKRRMRAGNKPLSKLQLFIRSLLEKNNRSMLLAEIEVELKKEKIKIPGNAQKANLVQELISKAGHIFVRVGHGQYGLAVWVQEETKAIVENSTTESMPITQVITKLKAKDLMTHGTYSIPTLVDILTASGEIVVSDEFEIQLTHSK